ncbi:MAG: D-aminoacylase [Bacillota bacterium]
MYRLIIRGGRMVDGSGAPWYYGDVAVSHDRIAHVGRVGKARAETVIDAGGQVVCPGFIDIHSHSDSVLTTFPQASSKIRQGITTEVVGQCGASAAPVDEVSQFENGQAGNWSTMGQYLDTLRETGIAVNVAALVGHSSIRRAVMRNDDRDPTAEEQAAMVAHVRAAMEQGAWGISTGLIYTPGMYARTPELVELAAEAARHRGLYFTHMRNEGAGLLESLDEALEIGKKAGIPVQISHLKATGEPNWGLVRPALSRMEEARARGIDVTADQYPYIASATSLSAVLPGWVREGSQDEVMAKLRNRRDKIKAQLREGDGSRDWNRVMVSSVARDEDRRWEGCRIPEIASARGQSAEDTVIDLLLDNGMLVGMVGFGLSEEDVKHVMAHPLVMIGSDASARSAQAAQGKPHPRCYGTFPRVLGKYVRQEGILTLEEAVRKMTSMPASRMGILDRGLIRPGMYADLVVFDPDTVMDTATFTEPHHYPAGISYVVVNGQLVLDGDRELPVLPGRVLIPG